MNPGYLRCRWPSYLQNCAQDKRTFSATNFTSIRHWKKVSVFHIIIIHVLSISLHLFFYIVTDSLKKRTRKYEEEKKRKTGWKGEKIITVHKYSNRNIYKIFYLKVLNYISKYISKFRERGRTIKSCPFFNWARLKK